MDNQGKFTLQGNANSMAENAQIWTEIAESEILRLKKRARGDDGLYYEIFYKECERDAYRELCEKIKSG